MVMKNLIENKKDQVYHTSPITIPTKARRIEARSPTKVPSTLTAPSVPLGTTLNVVTRYLHQEQKHLGEQTESLRMMSCPPKIRNTMGGVVFFRRRRLTRIMKSGLNWTMKNDNLKHLTNIRSVHFTNSISFLMS